MATRRTVRVRFGCCVIAQARSQHLCTEISARRRSAYLKVQDLAAAHAPQRKVSWPCSCDHRWSRSAAAQPLAGPKPSPWLTGGPKRAGGRESALHTLVPVVRG